MEKTRERGKKKEEARLDNEELGMKTGKEEGQRMKIRGGGCPTLLSGVAEEEDCCT